MGLLGILGRDDKKEEKARARYRAARMRAVRADDDNSPWAQALKKANSTRSTFWNNIKGEGIGQSWNRGNRIQHLKEHARARRRKIV